MSVGFILDATASPLTNRDVPATHKLHERHAPHWGQKWTKRNKVGADVVLPMRIGLKQSNLDVGHDKLMDISNPTSPNYGKHMSDDEVVKLFAPQQTSVATVTEWLVMSGLSAERIGQSANKQWIQFDATAAEVEELLFADFYIWEHVDGSHDLSTEAYYIPTHVSEHIDYLTPGIRLRPREKTGKNKNRKRSSDFRDIVKPMITQLPAFPNPNSTTCSIYVTADCTRVQYSIPNGTTEVPGNELGIFESLDDHYSKADLDVFWKTLYPYMKVPSGTYPEERLVDGAIGAVEEPSPVYPLEVGLESSLDFDSAWPLIWPQKTVLYQVDDEYYEYTGNFSGFWNTFLDAIDGSYCSYSAYGEKGDCTAPECADPVYPDPNPGGFKGKLQCGVYKPTNVISISYAGGEPYFPDAYMKRQCNEWMKLSLKGISIVMSSGDDGVGADGTCPTDAKGNEVFLPLYGSTCPYILSVGSTEWDRFTNSTPPKPWEKLHEVATQRFPSGGGFSNIFATPSYQHSAVYQYLDRVGKLLPFTGYSQFVKDGDFSSVKQGVYNRIGRAYPDVGAVGDRQVLYAGGSWWLVGGTSLSAPVWGAVLTLVNEQRLKTGKSTVGFIHPILYNHPEVFTDIIQGSNPGCNTTGFPAAAGWDPVTGLGSPNFPELLKLLMSL
ncbi:peptidase S8/S53 domain-containing protein [Pseudomassariella vexata]|uniref:Peptidase S8/S53 domain-containing protein n=1 Tax=Pseudomassariella vexata TaxID=1141098 RepID=A0A1Y2EAG0_9PEZI|nr:peptidase S8/S53 domain-containing protein [Pseudomassariella vexata]ORY68570.1 peptidase S8/S53 domain-containing protein [Pseudomassariella vexata]